MLVRVPDYFDKFTCLAGDCPHSCCEKWEVVLDEESVACYRKVEGLLGEKLRAAMQEDEEGDICFKLTDGRCPFLDGENLCEIHRQLGQEATSITCQQHPRFTEDYGSFREITLSASCPAANALLLSSDVPLTFREFETAEPEEEGDVWLQYLLPFREKMLALLADRSQPLKRRMEQFLLLAAEAQSRLETELEDTLPELAETWQPQEWIPQESGRPFFPDALRLLASLEVLEEDWPALMKQAEADRPAPASEYLLERIAVYFAFRYLLKCVNDGDLLSRAQLCVLAVLIIDRLSGYCGLSEALRQFSCEIEHSQENVDALQDAFFRGEILSLQQFLVALRI